MHIHVLETRVQRVTGTRLYGKSLIKLMADLDALHEKTSIAHAIWIDEEDIELIAGRGASVAHNPVCNLRIGSGVAPLRGLLRAGVNVALGTDGISSNDSCRLFDVMKAAGIIHTISTDDYDEWPTAYEILWAATRGGARAVGLDDQIGSIEPGKKADLVALDLCTSAFVPLNDVANQLVYAENGSSVRLVMVDGEVVVEDGRCTKIDEPAVLREARDDARAPTSSSTRWSNGTRASSSRISEPCTSGAWPSTARLRPSSRTPSGPELDPEALLVADRDHRVADVVLPPLRQRGPSATARLMSLMPGCTTAGRLSTPSTCPW